MTALKNNSSFLAALLLALATAASAAPAAGKASDGLVLPVMTSTQLHYGKLFIGVLATVVGPYLDEKEVRREGLHTRLAIAVEKEPSQYKEVDLATGQTVEVAGYRIKVESIAPGDRGSAVLRLWSPPPEPAKPTKKWPFNLFGKD